MEHCLLPAHNLHLSLGTSDSHRMQGIHSAQWNKRKNKFLILTFVAPCNLDEITFSYREK